MPCTISIKNYRLFISREINRVLSKHLEGKTLMNRVNFKSEFVQKQAGRLIHKNRKHSSSEI